MDKSSLAALVFKLHDARNLRVKRIVFADTHVIAGLEFRPTLPHDDRATGDRLPGKTLDPEPLRIRIPPVPRTS